MNEDEITYVSLWDKLAILCLVNLLSFYCFYLSGILYIDSSSLFFSPESKDVATVSSLLSFFLGFLLRPLGAVIFGIYGDMKGLKKSLIRSVLVLGATTVAIGLLPPFKMIGVTASLMNVLLRLLQGFAIGGTYACSAVLAYEMAPKNQKGRYTGFVQLSVPSGYLAALAAIIVLKLLLGIESFLEWGWRLCFVFAALLFWLALRLRKTEMTEGEKVPALSWPGFVSVWYDFLRDRALMRRFCLVIIPLMITLGVVGYVSNIYKLYFMQSILKIDQATSSFIIAISSIIYMPTYLLWGVLSDRSFDHRRRIILFGGLMMLILTYPLFWMMSRWVDIHQDATGQITGHTWALILISSLISGLAIISYSPLIAYVCERVPPAVRCTLFAISYNLGFGIFAGILHLLSGYFFEKYQWVFSGIIFMEVIGGLGLLTAWSFRRYLFNSAK